MTVPGTGTTIARICGFAYVFGVREGIGAKVWAEAQGRKWLREIRRARGYLSSSEQPAARFPAADRLTIEWPSGTRDEIGRLEPGLHVLVEGESKLTN